MELDRIPAPTGDTQRDIRGLYEALFRLWELEEYRWALIRKEKNNGTEKNQT